MKLKKKSGLMGAVIALSAASLVSVGFASWVISQGDSKTVSGTINVEEVNDERHIVTATWVASNALDAAEASNPVVKFGSNSASTDGWLSNDLGDTEALVFYLKVNVTNISASDFDSKVTFLMTSESGTHADYAGAVTEKYVGSLPALTAEANGVGSIVKGAAQATGTGNKDYEAIFTIKFVWGQAFDYQNPFDYYNDGDKEAEGYVSGTSGPTWADDANTKLTDMYDKLSAATFSLKVSAAA